MVELQGRRALVTGAASGIGRALAIKLAQAGCNLFLLDVDEDGLKQVAAELVLEQWMKYWMRWKVLH